MSIRINLGAPINPERISRIKIYRSLYPDGGYSVIADLIAHDGNGNFVSVYEDPCGKSHYYYKCGFVDAEGAESVSDPIRLCKTSPVMITYSVPAKEDWQVDTIYVLRSDSVNGEYDTVAKLSAKADEFGVWRTSFTDIGGSPDFFYKVAFVYSRWNDEECKSEFYSSPMSDPVSPINIDGNLVAKITVGHLAINDMRTVESITFRAYPYCGYHRFSPQDVFRGTAASPYSRPNDMSVGGLCGGNSLFGGPLNIYERNLQQQQMLLETTGESVILLRRKWDGKICPCVSKTEEHPTKQCPTCMGVGIVGGYDRIYFNENNDNPEGRILLRFYPAVDDLALRKFTGLDVMNEPNAWTLAQPIIRDRDILVQFDPIDKEREIWRYEVLDVTRNAFIGGVTGAQVMRLKRLNRLNDIAYSVPLFGTMETELWDMESNIHNSYGHNTGLRSGERISVDCESQPARLDEVDANMLLDAYVRKLWPFVRIKTVPSYQMIANDSDDPRPMVFVGFNDALSLSQVNPSSETINNQSILRYIRIELDESLLKEYSVEVRSVNSGELLKTFVVPAGQTTITITDSYVFDHSVKIALNQSVRSNVIIVMLLERE